MSYFQAAALYYGYGGGGGGGGKNSIGSNSGNSGVEFGASVSQINGASESEARDIERPVAIDVHNSPAGDIADHLMNVIAWEKRFDDGTFLVSEYFRCPLQGISFLEKACLLPTAGSPISIKLSINLRNEYKVNVDNCSLKIIGNGVISLYGGEVTTSGFNPDQNFRGFENPGETKYIFDIKLTSTNINVFTIEASDNINGSGGTICWELEGDRMSQYVTSRYKWNNFFQRFNTYWWRF